jgi:hypothetical protein
MSSHLPPDAATSWFDDLYRTAQRDSRAIPWAGLDPCPWLGEFLGTQNPPGRAVVVGCGLGDDAEAVAAAGFETTAFDVSPEAIEWCRDRFPDSTVTYRVANLLDLPGDLVHSADLVVEVRTVQSLPLSVRSEAIEGVVSLLDDDGVLFVAALGRHDDTIPTGPPWAVSDRELKSFEAAGLERVSGRVERGQMIRVYQAASGSDRSRHE